MLTRLEMVPDKPAFGFWPNHCLIFGLERTIVILCNIVSTVVYMFLTTACDFCKQLGTQKGPYY